jgi:general secretion pathway protein N
MALSPARWPRSTWLAVAGGTTFLVAVVAGAPAALLAQPLANAGVATRAVRGTLWRGEADGVVVLGIRIDRLRWALAPAALVTGRLAASVDARLPDNGFAEGRVTVGAGGLALADFTGAAPLAALGPATAALGASGDVRLRLERVEWRDGWFVAAVGSVEAANVDTTFGAVPGGSGPGGGFAVRFDAPEVPPGDPVTGAVTDTGGPLELAATLTLNPPGTYRIEGTARARPGAPPALASGLRLLGPDDGRGGHAVSLEGSF